MLLADGDRMIGPQGRRDLQADAADAGVDSPDHGPVLASTVYRDGDTDRARRFIAPKMEAEIVFVLAAPLEGPA